MNHQASKANQATSAREARRRQSVERGKELRRSKATRTLSDGTPAWTKAYTSALYSDDLSDRQFRLLAVLEEVQGNNGSVWISEDVLTGLLNRTCPKPVRADLVALFEAGYLTHWSCLPDLAPCHAGHGKPEQHTTVLQVRGVISPPDAGCHLAPQRENHSKEPQNSSLRSEGVDGSPPPEPTRSARRGSRHRDPRIDLVNDIASLLVAWEADARLNDICEDYDLDGYQAQVVYGRWEKAGVIGLEPRDKRVRAEAWQVANQVLKQGREAA